MTGDFADAVTPPPRPAVVRDGLPVLDLAGAELAGARKAAEWLIECAAARGAGWFAHVALRAAGRVLMRRVELCEQEARRPLDPRALSAELEQLRRHPE